MREQTEPGPLHGYYRFVRRRAMPGYKVERCTASLLVLVGTPATGRHTTNRERGVGVFQYRCVASVHRQPRCRVGVLLTSRSFGIAIYPQTIPPHLLHSTLTFLSVRRLQKRV